MHMGVVMKLLPPGMQDCQEAYLSAKVLGVSVPTIKKTKNPFAKKEFGMRRS